MYTCLERDADASGMRSSGVWAWCSLAGASKAGNKRERRNSDGIAASTAVMTRLSTASVMITNANETSWCDGLKNRCPLRSPNWTLEHDVIRRTGLKYGLDAA